ncbi:unnamed protein product, partial [Ectocarpus sp. 6 AP-2014]
RLLNCLKLDTFSPVERANIFSPLELLTKCSKNFSRITYKVQNCNPPIVDRQANHPSSRVLHNFKVGWNMHFLQYTNYIHTSLSSATAETPIGPKRLALNKTMLITQGGLLRTLAAAKTNVSRGLET